jgi:hypothetical protein
MAALFRQTFLVLCACLLGGTHWAVLQVAAWTSMAIDSAGRGPGVWGARVGEIVSGQRPCHLCHAIDAGRRQEQGDDRNAPAAVKIVAAKYCVPDQAPVPTEPEQGSVKWFSADLCAVSRVLTPPTPPPRA